MNIGYESQRTRTRSPVLEKTSEKGLRYPTALPLRNLSECSRWPQFAGLPGGRRARSNETARKVEKR